MGCSISSRSYTPPILAGGAVVGHVTGSPAASSFVSSYEAACMLDPELQSFDATLRQRTSRVLSTLAMDGEVPSLSLDNLRAATADLLEMNQEAHLFILKNKKDILKNADLLDFVKDYLDNCLLTIHFCDTLKNCLGKASESQSIIRFALQRFTEDDAREADQGGKQKYARTLDELRRFMSAGNPITKEFSYPFFRTLHRQQVTMLEKLRSRREKLDKKLKTLTTWRRVSNILFASVFAAAIICSIVLAVAAPPTAAAAVGAAAAMPIPMGNWIDSLLKEYQKSLEGDEEIVNSIECGSVAMDMDGIPSQVGRLEMHIKSMLEYADFALRDEEAVRFEMEEIREKSKEFAEGLRELAKQAERCSRNIQKAQTDLLLLINRHPRRASTSSKSDRRSRRQIYRSSS
ncbi:UPF0496 protein 1-like [Zingiber officinale]|uniref:Uncharacterized protein n=1 Tax=Zingiber officinale TaxID=94328 RepID=A0A8J5EVF1_ZINOF|nr:UPF0496 protein 1-like [Zingiber officinale]KAG6473386.1 hypothetical protein ZIOFF_067302 [Zingiber officinale]